MFQSQAQLTTGDLTAVFTTEEGTANGGDVGTMVCYERKVNGCFHYVLHTRRACKLPHCLFVHPSKLKYNEVSLAVEFVYLGPVSR